MGKLTIVLQKSTHIEPVFNEEKASQVAAIFIKLCGGTVNYMKLIKLIYLAERQALLDWGKPITYDSYFFLDKGPVLSNTLNKIKDRDRYNSQSSWHKYISVPENYDVSLREECDIKKLSKAERELLNKIFQKYGHYDEWELVDLLHSTLPEWKDPSNSAIPISYRDILKAGNKSEEEIECIEEEISHACFAAKIFTTDNL